MLAYLFWHWPRSTVPTADYEAALTAFHDGLRTTGCPGLRRSLVFRIRGAIWARPADAYADWYLLDDSGALDRLNAAAVAPPLVESHARCAEAAAGGVGGLYRSRNEEPAGVSGAVALWLSKPPGMAYDDFYARLSPLTSAPERSLWRRQMVLGPAPEFCLLSDMALPYPTDLPAVRVQRELVYG